jgi:DNA replication protein
MTFAGFSARARSTAIPNAFFTDVLPALADDPVAFAVAIYAFKALQAKHGSPRFITGPELAADTSLVPCLRSMGTEEPAAGIQRGLARVVDAGVLLPLGVEREGRIERLYFLNAPADRRGMEALQTGGTEIGRIVAPLPAVSASPPSIFALYESLAGTLGPGIAEELAEAERLYPAEWLEAAFREAAAQNARSWRYVTRILERWASEGRGDAATERDLAGDERYFHGKYGRILRDRLEG